MEPEGETNRRQVLRSLGAAAALPLAGCGEDTYDRVAREIWRPRGGAGDSALAAQREWVRCATLAANSHNTQPWRFVLAPTAVEIEPDFTRRTPVVDPDDHHLWVSLGCAAENLVQAAAADARASAVTFTGTRLRVEIGGAAKRRAPLFADAIAERQSTRAEYAGAPLAAAELRLLEGAAAEPGVQLLLLPSRLRIEKLVDLMLAANGMLIEDAAYRAELKSWIRFNPRDAIASGDGLYAGTTGNPSLPRWLGRPLFDLVYGVEAENDKLARQLRSSAGLAVFVAERAGPAGWAAVGRACQRFLLQATLLDIRTAFVNPAIEAATLRPRFAAAIGIPGRRPDLVLRFGRGARLPRSLRRPVDVVLRPA